MSNLRECVQEYDEDLKQLEAGMLLYDAFCRWWPGRHRRDAQLDFPSAESGCEDEGLVMTKGVAARADHQTAQLVAHAEHGVSLGETFRVWLKVALLSFGGPAGQIAVMHRILVEEKRWIGESRFLHAFNYCILLPGPNLKRSTRLLTAILRSAERLGLPLINGDRWQSHLHAH